MVVNRMYYYLSIISLSFFFLMGMYKNGLVEAKQSKRERNLFLKKEKLRRKRKEEERREREEKERREREEKERRKKEERERRAREEKERRKKEERERREKEELYAEIDFDDESRKTESIFEDVDQELIEQSDRKKVIYFNLMEPKLVDKEGNFWKGGVRIKSAVTSFLKELRSAYEDSTSDITYHNLHIANAIRLWKWTIAALKKKSRMLPYNTYVTRIAELYAKKFQGMKEGQTQLFTLSLAGHAILGEMILRGKSVSGDIYDIKIYNAGSGYPHQVNTIWDHTNMPKEERKLFMRRVDVEELTPTLFFEGVALDENTLRVFLKTLLALNISDIELASNGHVVDVIVKHTVFNVIDKSKEGKDNRNSYRSKWYRTLLKIVLDNGGRVKSPTDRASWHKLQRGPMCTKKQTSLWMRENFDPVLYSAIRLHQVEYALKELERIKRQEKSLPLTPENREDLEVTYFLLDHAKQKKKHRKNKLDQMIEMNKELEKDE